jgi:hypothetical protein
MDSAPMWWWFAMVCPREVGNARIIAPNQFSVDHLGLPQFTSRQADKHQVALPGYISTRALDGFGLPSYEDRSRSEKNVANALLHSDALSSQVPCTVPSDVRILTNAFTMAFDYRAHV